MPMGAASLHYPRRESLGDGLRALHRESGGVVLLQIVRPLEAGALAELAAGGDAEAEQLLEASLQVIQRVASASRRDPVCCAACKARVLGMQFACAVVLPYQASADAGIGMAICWGCGTEPAAILAAAQNAIRELWPNTRAIRATHTTGGRA